MHAIAATPAPAADLTWLAGLRDLTREHGFEPLRVEGTLPAELTGTLYRTGPARFSSFGRRYQHWFDGDGAVSAVRFAGGHAQGAVKLVQSAGLLAERKAGKALYGGYGTIAPGWRRFLPRFKNAANTAMLCWNDRVFALFEPGKPTEIAAADLATLGETDLGGVIPMAFSAHPHRVPARRATYNFGVRYGRKTVVDLFELADGGGARKLGELPLAQATMIHDFIATERHLVFFAPPLRMNPLRLLTGMASYSDALRWHPADGTEIIVVPIDDPSRPTRFTVEPFYQWHFANAFERGDELVVDLVRYPDFASNAWLGGLARGEVTPLELGRYVRATLAPARRAARFEERWSSACEFPRVAPRAEAAAHRVAYLASHTPAAVAAHGLPDAIARLEVETGAARVWPTGAGVASEPVFVARPGGTGEDDGWVLALLYDAATDRSCVAVLDARDPSAGPLARAWFDQHIPPTFHGAFAPATH